MNDLNFPKKNIGFFPTPLHKLENLTKYFNRPSIYIKRDDMTGLAFGGNKTRKLEFLMGDALSKNCDCVITGGASQSNHCRQTAAAAAQSGLECHLALGGEEPDSFTGNLLLDKLFDAKIHWCGEFRKGEKIPAIYSHLAAKGKKPYIIPYGGSNKIGALGFVEAMGELKSQSEEMKIKIDKIIFASSSGGTHSGMIVGNILYNLNSTLIGVQIDKSENEDKPYSSLIAELANEILTELDIKRNVNEKDLILRNEFMSDGYGIVGELERNAIKLLAGKEGILVDPVYTGRVFGALMNMIENKEFSKGENVLFWHTGGTPALFSYYDKLF